MQGVATNQDKISENIELSITVLEDYY